MTNQEKKQEHWAKIAPKYSHLENHCTIELVGIDDDSIYYHPRFNIEEGVFITTQADVGNNFNRKFYAPRFTSNADSLYSIELYEDHLESVIVSWKQNKDVVILAFDTLQKVNSHVDKMRQYTTDYINNLLIGSSVSQLSNDFINEIKTATKVIELMQAKK